jgi:hypothetical protein
MISAFLNFPFGGIFNRNEGISEFHKNKKRIISLDFSFFFIEMKMKIIPPHIIIIFTLFRGNEAG